MHVTHRYDLWTVRSGWRTKHQDEYTAPVILSNLSISKAIRLYGVEAVAFLHQIGQLQDKGVWAPIKYENIQDKSKIIRCILFLKRKIDVILKARLVADGRMQDRSTSQDNSSPTMATETLFLMAAIFAAESRHVDYNIYSRRTILTILWRKALPWPTLLVFLTLWVVT